MYLVITHLPAASMAYIGKLACGWGRFNQPFGKMAALDPLTSTFYPFLPIVLKEEPFVALEQWGKKSP